MSKTTMELPQDLKNSSICKLSVPPQKDYSIKDSLTQCQPRFDITLLLLTHSKLTTILSPPTATIANYQQNKKTTTLALRKPSQTHQNTQKMSTPWRPKNQIKSGYEPPKKTKVNSPKCRRARGACRRGGPSSGVRRASRGRPGRGWPRGRAPLRGVGRSGPHSRGWPRGGRR
jgi:hypothetical protein